MNVCPHVVLAALALLPPALGQGFVDKTAALGIGTIPRTTAQFGAGVAVADFDGDLDVIVPGARGIPHLYLRNDGRGVSSTLPATHGSD